MALTGSGQELLQSKEAADRYLGVGVQLESSCVDEENKLAKRLSDLLPA